MAQASLRRPAIEVGPAHAWILQLLAFAAHRMKARLAVRIESARMIERVGVEAKPRRAARKSPLDRPVEQPRADPATDVGERKAEEGEFVVGQFEIADQIAVVAGAAQPVAVTGPHGAAM